MHQDQVIEELLGDENNDGDFLDGAKNEGGGLKSGQNGANEKKKKKKKKKAAPSEELKVSEQPESETSTPKKQGKGADIDSNKIADEIMTKSNKPLILEEIKENTDSAKL